MKTKQIIKRLVTSALLGCSSLGVFAQGAGQILVAGTDFECPGYEKDFYASFAEVQQNGLTTMDFTSNSPFAESADRDWKTLESDFHDTPHYAVTNNPIKLDSSGYFDLGEKKWYMVFSAPKASPTQAALFTFTASGFEPGCLVTVDMGFASVVNPEPDPKLNQGIYGQKPNNGKICVGNQLQGKIWVSEGNTQGSLQRDQTDIQISISETDGSVKNYKLLKANADAEGKVTVSFYPQNPSSCCAYALDHIYIYGTIKPKINGTEQVCAGGESVVLSAARSYMNSTIQWYKNGTAIPGATGTSVKHVSGDIPGTKTTYTYEVIAADGGKAKSDPYVVEDILCCSNPDGSPASRKLIWQDDFGTFTSPTNYWVWDYSDISDPKKVQYKNGKNWSRCLDKNPEGAECVTVPQGEGTYSVAANVTCTWDGAAGPKGTNWEWQAYFGNGKSPGDNGYPYAPDHTYGGTDYGAMMFLNCGNEKDGVIYERTIKGLCERNVFVKCFINTFSKSDNPVDIYIKVTDLKTNDVYKSERVTRYAAESSGLGWAEVSIPVELKGTEIKFEIISYGGGAAYNKEGNDLVLDDIQVWACSEPTVDLFFDLTDYTTQEESCDGDKNADGKSISLNVEVTKMIETNYNGEAHYIFQATTTPENNKSWKTIAGPDKLSSFKDVKSIVAAQTPPLIDGDKLYFRAVLGLKDALEQTAEFKPNEPCASYSVSDTIVLNIKCPSCTKPEDIVITPSKKAKADKKVYLCAGESVTLKTNNVVPDASTWASPTFDGYTLSWTDNKTAAGKKKGTNTDSSDELKLTNPGVSADEEHEITVLAADNEYLDMTLCQTEATITVVYLAKPTVEPKTHEFCEGIPNALTDKMPEVSVTTNQIFYYEDKDGTTPVTAVDFTTLKAADSPVTYYYNEVTADGCPSDTQSITITVNAIPIFEVTPDEYEFCAGQTTTILPTEDATAGVKIDWNFDPDLSTQKGNATPYDYIYTVTDATTGCEAEPQHVSVLAKPAIEITQFEETVTCGLTTVHAKLNPPTATYSWYVYDFATDTEKEATNTLDEEWSTNNYENVRLKIVGEMNGYCKAADSIELVTKVAPVVIATSDVSYIKKQQFEENKSLFEASGKLTPTISNGNEDGDLVLQFCDDPGYAVEFDEKTIDATTVNWLDAGIAPVPQATDVDDLGNETRWYAVRVYNQKTDCYSGVSKIRVDFFGAPVPKVRDTVLCLGRDALTLADYVKVDNSKNPNGQYTLKYYTNEAKTAEVPGTTVPATDAAGVQYFWATQVSTDDNLESEPVRFKITTYDVMKPEVATDPFNYCKDAPTVELSATEKSDADKQLGFSGFQWSLDGTNWGNTAITPSSAAVGSTTYYVRQYYILANQQDKCASEPAEITVNIEETPAPVVKSPLTYLYSEQENKGSFSPLNVNEPDVVKVETGYNYYYAECDKVGNLLPGAAWSSVVPTPENVAPLNGGSVEKYYAVKRDSVDGAKCESEASVITVVITDAPMPIVNPVFFCDGETPISFLDEHIVRANNSVNATAVYELLYYGTTKPDLSEMATAGKVLESTDMLTIKSLSTEAPTVTTYYFAQKDVATGAISSASALDVTVYPKPVLKIENPDAVCETAVALNDACNMTNTKIMGTTYSTLFYEDDQKQKNIPTGSVKESGTYYAQISFPTINAFYTGSLCTSDVMPIDVTVDTLKVNEADNSTTCPDTEGKLELSIVTNAATAVYEWTDAKAPATETPDATDGSANNVYITAPLAGPAGTVYQYDVKVTAGACVKNYSEVHGTKLNITVGDGPVVGSLVFDDEENTASGATFNGTEKEIKFYYCGKDLRVTADFDTTGQLATPYTWTGSNGFSMKSDKGGTVQLPDAAAGTYTLTYINKCETSVTFEVIDASIKNNLLTLTTDANVTKEAAATATTPAKHVICENEPIDFNLGMTVVNQKDFEIEWSKDAALLAKFKDKENNKIISANPDDSGLYSYTISNAGCTATGKMDVVVRPYIQFVNNKLSYIARRDSALDIVTELKVPAAATAFDSPTYTWKDADGFDYKGDITLKYDVASDKNFTLTISDDEKFCPASAEVEVLMDGRLQLSATVKDQMCRGDKGVYLEIDTTGTGKLVKKNEYKLEITETLGTISHILNAPVQMFNGIMKYEIHPTEDATYTITASYRNNDATATPVDVQIKEAEVSITVLQPIMITVPKGLRACDGDELEITLESVTPVGKVTVNWSADNTIQGNTDDTESITVKPVYDEATGHNHKSTKVYNLTATMDGCADKDYKVNVTVDEPIEGAMSDTTICEGYSVRLDASNYQATEYVWTTASVGNDLSKSASLVVSPDRKTIYTIDMTRGKCTATEHVTVNVNEKPKIAEQVDSVGIRSRIIVLENESSEAMPYTYYIDGKEEGQTSAQFDSLRFSGHTVVVEDRFGCLDTVFFTLIAPPVNIPIWFSPNGDGSFDNWECPEITNVYPEAEVKIFDRWGKELAKFTGADGGWDGTYNGNPMPSTDYWYEIHVREIDKVYTGHFTLIRR